MPDDLKILIVDDTVVYRRILSEVVGAVPGAVVAGTAPNGKIALEKMARSPVDLVLLDLEMPVMDGIETLEAIRRQHPDVGVIMVSGASRSAADITMRALEKGALDFVPKPAGADPQASRDRLVNQLRPLVSLFATKRNLGRAAATRRPPSTEIKPAAGPREPRPFVRARRPTQIDVLAIGVSTGGPNALAEVIPKLPGDLNVPVLVVQHMPPVFTKSLADSLAKKASLAVREASDGEPIAPNTILIAPGGRHMVVRGSANADDPSTRYVGLNDNPPENSCRPSVDVLFRSVAAYYGGHVLVVVMTGMGNDGCEGVRVMKRRGCICLSQSEETCVVYGMPQAVDEAGLSDERVPLPNLADRIARLVKRPRTG